MSAARKTTFERDMVAETARAALEAASGDIAKAVAALEKAVRADRPLRDALTDPLIAAACYDAVRKQVHVDRKRVWNPSPVTEKLVPSKVSGAYRVVQLAQGTLLMFPLPNGGKKLGEATREEIASAAEFYEKQAADMAHKARWLRLVVAAIPPTLKACDVLSDATLRELQAEAERG